MPDYAGAKQAMRDRFDNAWTATRITYQNETPAAPWPPVTPDPQPDDPNAVRLAPWVNLEIIGSGSRLVGTGLPGRRVWEYEGEINVHVFVPVGSADADATALALAAGEIFRAAHFYPGPDGQCVRTLSPSIDDGDSADDSGSWFRCTMSCDFTYRHIG